ncbi:transporter [Rhizobium sp. KVB221]|uniref:Transporter n=1 Tax=Rhizobium setariae TaxID=2801340 RepID=A0A936YRY8_9HYPH|nr:RbsD/FucU domain-containing protein [Rhizobium setariae]MBL0371517.1 transporter [Rhizobium setariae]
MLRGIDPVLGPELLATLRTMGHGDEIALVDGNYPGAEHARRLIRADGHDVIRVLDAILSVMPIDDFVENGIFRASVRGDLYNPDPVHKEMVATCQRWEPARTVIALEPDSFYARVRSAHAIVQTSEPRLYGNIILRKGVVHSG